MKKCFSLFIAICISFSLSGLIVHAGENTASALDVAAPSAILMEASTGMVLWEKDANLPLPPASVTKVMTLLLVMEAIDAGKLTLDDTVTVSEHAASMGGSQIYLEPGETMSVSDMLKSVVISSANDAACALAEHISGSEDAFVADMNRRAGELGMVNTNFENTNGLDDTADNHYTSARDIAIMSRELIEYPVILEYSSTWMDSVRNGEFGLSNTNRLIRFYRGANGLKTGSTSKAKFCISATAERDGMTLIAVIMASETRDTRNEAAKQLLDYGFANFARAAFDGGEINDISLNAGEVDFAKAEYPPFSAVVPKGSVGQIEQKLSVPDTFTAPLSDGQSVGKVTYSLGGEIIGESDITISGSYPRIGFSTLLSRMIKKALHF